jgi:hypothetical protein
MQKTITTVPTRYVDEGPERRHIFNGVHCPRRYKFWIALHTACTDKGKTGKISNAFGSSPVGSPSL